MNGDNPSPSGVETGMNRVKRGAGIEMGTNGANRKGRKGCPSWGQNGEGPLGPK